MRVARDLSAADVARRTGVATRTAAKWIDSGLLAGYKLPGSRHRRVQPAALEKFCREHGIPHLAISHTSC